MQWDFDDPYILIAQSRTFGPWQWVIPIQVKEQRQFGCLLFWKKESLVLHKKAANVWNATTLLPCGMKSLPRKMLYKTLDTNLEILTRCKQAPTNRSYLYYRRCELNALITSRRFVSQFQMKYHMLNFISKRIKIPGKLIRFHLIRRFVHMYRCSKWLFIHEKHENQLYCVYSFRSRYKCSFDDPKSLETIKRSSRRYRHRISSDFCLISNKQSANPAVFIALIGEFN